MIKKIKVLMCLLCGITMLMQYYTVYAESSEFNDIENDYACYEPVLRLSELGIINGYDDGSFRPWDYVKRSEFSKIIVSMMDKVVEAKSTPPTSAFDDVNQVQWCIPYVNYLTSNGIIKGYADATFKPDNVITYAEAVTIICRILGYTEENIGYSWPSNYINEANALGLNEGMSFNANDAITRAAAAIIVDRAMFTYVNNAEETTYLESIGYKVYGDSYIIATSHEDSDIKSDELRTSEGIFKTLSTSASDMLGRKGTLVLNKNNQIVLFMPETSESIFDSLTSKEDYLALEEIGYTIIEDCFISATKAQESSLTAYQIRTSSGVYEVENTDILNKVNCMGTLVLNASQRAVMFVESQMESMNAAVTKMSGTDTIEYKTDTGSKGTFTFNSNFVVYYDNNKTTYQSVSQQIQVGTSLTFYGDIYGDWSFAVITQTADSVVPVRATKDYTDEDTSLEGTPINFDGLIVYKNNKTVSVSDIEMNDVVYYNTATNIMDVYNKKVSGIYNEALPSKAYVTSVNVGGNVYTINENVSTSSLDASNGSFEIGERVTLLLGENDEVCFAVELTGFNTFDYGVLLKTYKEISKSGENEGSSQIMASIFMADGNTYEYRISRDYSNYVGDLVYIEYGQDSIVSLSGVTSSDTYGELSVANRTLGGKTVLKDVVIFSRLSDDEAETAEVELLDFSKLDVTSITNDQLITSVSANNFGDIAILYLKNMPSSYLFGVYKGNDGQSQITNDDGTVEREGVDATIYRIYSDGLLNEYTIDGRYSVALGPVMYKLSGNSVAYMKALNEIASATDIDAVEGGRIMLNNKVYKMDDDVQIVDVTDVTNYKTISISELEQSNVSSVRLYSESKASEDGTVRIILVKRT